MAASVLVLAALVAAPVTESVRLGEHCTVIKCVHARGNDGAIEISAGYEDPGVSTSPVRADAVPSRLRTEHTWTIACGGNTPDGRSDDNCGFATTYCPPTQPPELLYWRWTRVLEIATGAVQRGWEQTGQTCSPFPPAADSQDAVPEVTPQVVQHFFDHEPLLTSTAGVQPAVRTLVQLPTIFFTTATVQSFDEVVFGRSVHIEGTPVGYEWQFGDGATESTQNPGRPYPAKDITHVYETAGVTVHPSVRVSYAGRYTVDGGAWIPVPEHVTVQGPAIDLRIMQARAELVSGEG